MVNFYLKCCKLSLLTEHNVSITPLPTAHFAYSFLTLCSLKLLHFSIVYLYNSSKHNDYIHHKQFELVYDALFLFQVLTRMLQTIKDFSDSNVYSQTLISMLAKIYQSVHFNHFAFQLLCIFMFSLSPLNVVTQVYIHALNYK